MDPIKLEFKSETIFPHTQFVFPRNLADLCRGVLNGARKQYPNGGALGLSGGCGQGLGRRQAGLGRSGWAAWVSWAWLGWLGLGRAGGCARQGWAGLGWLAG